MVIVQINYRRPDMPNAAWEARYTDDRARPFLDVAGLVASTCSPTARRPRPTSTARSLRA